MTDEMPAFFTRDGDDFVPTSHAVGPWNPNSLHGRVVAGLLGRTLGYLNGLTPGFDPNNVVTAQASLQDARYKTSLGQPGPRSTYQIVQRPRLKFALERGLRRAKRALSGA